MHAGRLADNLRDRDVAEVFIDVDEIKLGENFEKRIEEEISRCDAFLIMIGDDWLSLMGRDGRPRIFDDRDWVHLEVRAALDRDVPVIPVLVEDTMMPRPDQLPAEIRALASRQGAEMRESSWRQDYDRLATGLPAPVEASGESSRAPSPSTAARRERAQIDFVAARSFIEGIPRGRWTSYGDVSLAGGSPTGAIAIGNWLSQKGNDIPNVWRVLNTRGEVSDGWAPVNPNLPPTPDGVRALLETEGVGFSQKGRAADELHWGVADAADDGVAVAIQPDERVAAANDLPGDTLIVAGRRAYPDYSLADAYICQPGRSFRSGIERMGFYTGFQIKPELPRILHRRDNVSFTPANAAALATRDEPFDEELARLITRVLDPTLRWAGRRELGNEYQVFLLTSPNHLDTLRLDEPVRHRGKSAWVQSQRYTNSGLLRAAGSTDEL